MHFQFSISIAGIRRARAGVVALVVIFMAGLGPALAAKGNQAPNYGPMKEAMRQIFVSGQRLPLPIKNSREALEAYYVTEDAGFYWVGTGRMTSFIDRLADAADDGLKPEDYPTDYLRQVRDKIDVSDPVASAYAELAFSAFFLHYASDLKVGRFIPKKVDPKFYVSHREVDEVAILEGLAQYDEPSVYLDSFEPQNPHYRALKALLRRYRAIDARGGWPQIPAGDPLKPGARDPRVAVVRARLVAAGDISASTSKEPDVYDGALVLAIEQFQKRHGLDADGVIGKDTFVQLNVAASERVRQIIVNMERWRWMPDYPDGQHIIVNIAGFRLERWVSGIIVDRIPVIVGRTYHQTPVFSDEIEYVELNPTWTVPYSIATHELLPKLQANAGALGSGFEVLSNGQAVSPSAINWNAYSARDLPFTFRQKAGDRNALGRVKFVLPNPYSIYLHDTPSRGLFAQTTRAFSHGCIRVYQPVKLAEKILASAPGWTPQKIAKVLQSNVTTRINLPRHIPVQIVYATAWLGEGGSVEFRADIYGRDLKLYRALFGEPTV